ncbi:MAG: iron-containing alcohol dehydrogenase, partial [Candidatus Omnitrophica bacterium]|nr:iron-containing alcohol dehydrogenase [Candidatus Omnitrophota bacterium]
MAINNIQEFTLPGKIIFGWGALETVGKESSLLGKKCLVVTGQHSMKRMGFTDVLAGSLEKKGLEAVIYDKVEEDPSLNTVDMGLEMGRKSGCDMVIGLGGGSAMDTAKSIAGIFREDTNSIREFYDGVRIARHGIPFIAIPTTSGSSAEVTNNAVLTDTEKGIKKSVRSPEFLARVIIADPELTLGLSPRQTAISGMDALTHAIEGYVSLGATPWTDALALEAIELIGKNLHKAFLDGGNKKAREGMSMGSLMAGMAFSNAKLGAVHALAHPVGIRYKISHGAACAILLPPVIEFNLAFRKKKFNAIKKTLG